MCKLRLWRIPPPPVQEPEVTAEVPTSVEEAQTHEEAVQESSAQNIAEREPVDLIPTEYVTPPLTQDSI